MKIIDANCGLLTNQEVLHVLRDRGADPSSGPSSRALPSERAAYQALLARAGGVVLPREELEAAVEELQQGFGLTRPEVVQVLNLAPATPVEVHLIVDDCERRLSEQRIDALLAAVRRRMPAAVAAGQAAALGEPLPGEPGGPPVMGQDDLQAAAAAAAAGRDAMQE